MGNLQIPVLNEEDSKHLPKGVDFECKKNPIKNLTAYTTQATKHHVRQETNGQQKARHMPILSMYGIFTYI